MKRGKWQGVLAIVRFNWPFYGVAVVVFLAAVVGMVVWRDPWALALFFPIAMVSGYFVFVSLGVSHLIYDRSDLYRWQWLNHVLGGRKIGRIVFCHAGFDETSEALREKLPGTEWRVLDHYDPVSMTEASVRRARKLYPPTQVTEAAPFGLWPVEDGWADMVFGILAIHELRLVEERAKWFAQAKRCLTDDGRIIVIEHIRDLANFLAFGPGFLHFHSVKTWERSWESEGLCLIDSFRITHFLRVFVIGKA